MIGRNNSKYFERLQNIFIFIVTAHGQEEANFKAHSILKNDDLTKLQLIIQNISRPWATVKFPINCMSR